MNTLPINTIINGECVSEMKKLPDSCIDLIIADPPYNLSKGGEWKWDNSVELQGMGGNWNKPRESLNLLALCGFLVHIIILVLSILFAKCSELRSSMRLYGTKEMLSRIWQEED